jgi:hypothetical protein
MGRGTDFGFASSKNKSEDSRVGEAGLGKDFHARWTRESAGKGGFARPGRGRRRERT